MANAIAFFPWIHIDAPLTIGQLRLLPYRQGQLPGDLVNMTQADIEGVFAAYANRPKSPIKRGILLELGDWQAGMPVSPEQLDALFRAKEALAFSALSKRVLFRGHFDYVNSDAYSLVVQRFSPGKTATFSFNTRRRDTGTMHLWGSDSFAFQRPSHTGANWSMKIDEALVNSLIQLPPEDKRIHEAVVEFNAANTDSSSVPEHVEVVMCKSALECLLDVDEKLPALIQALNNTLIGLRFADSDGPLKNNWGTQWPNSSSTLVAWAREFCFIRNNAAHGNEKTKKLVWQEGQHLAFVSILFPLLVKKVLADKGALPLSDETVEQLRHIEGYLMHDPFAHDFEGVDDSDNTHPWLEVGQRARIAAISRTYHRDPPEGAGTA